MLALVCAGCSKDAASSTPAGAPKAEPKAEAPKVEPKAEAPKAEAKAEAPKAEAKAEAPKAEGEPTAAQADESAKAKEENMAANPVVLIETSLGNIKVELTPDQTPGTVKNFLEYVNEGFYDGTIFHRVVPGFVIQGGGFTPQLEQKATRAPIVNEAAKAISNDRGTICMARTPARDSATSQFYINLNNNKMLNYRGESPSGWGYCAFGKVTEGMDVVDKIAAAPTGPAGPFPGDVPQQTVSINKISLLK
jgi:peptidyl-prolyl cis-trans isomerase A (cyclophilin A)/peptidyl-prolyl cis-trans isomerase B (cyclophilin B)